MYLQHKLFSEFNEGLICVIVQMSQTKKTKCPLRKVNTFLGWKKEKTTEKHEIFWKIRLIV